MSATLNISEFSNYYNNCPCLKIPGFTYTVQELYLEDIYALKKLVPLVYKCLKFMNF